MPGAINDIPNRNRSRSENGNLFLFRYICIY
jgi:hypothetical protein